METHTIQHGYTAILSDQPFGMPSVIVVCRNEDAEAWEAFWATQAAEQALPVAIRQEALVSEAQISALEETGAAIVACILPLAVGNRHALVDARRAVLGQVEISRGPDAWWRTAPQQVQPPYFGWGLIAAHPSSHAMVRASAQFSFLKIPDVHLFLN
ncbi:hypothetical protein [Deinococcus ruber]|uniref:Uncharacterized protein n=1 Tax=Deinococcus ruber TaxID=1848197 RepID=A0A918CND5_9DEIO|nr:hypothetical protein [Deinococcus ruber]GGR30360.1 hypothetical protein GCM10008957_46450 [Deinococcus ruber]